MEYKHTKKKTEIEKIKSILQFRHDHSVHVTHTHVKHTLRIVKYSLS